MKRLPNISVLVFAIFLIMFVVTVIAQHHQVFYRGPKQRHAEFVKHTSTILDVISIISVKVQDVMSCTFSCMENALCLSFNFAAFPDEDNGDADCQLLATDKYNSSDRLKSSKDFNHYSIKSPCESSPCQNGGTCRPVYEQQDYTCTCTLGFVGKHCQKTFKGKSCGEALGHGLDGDGVYELLVQKQNLKVFCDMTNDKKGWTLIARFSNNDTKNWMKNSGKYWYDKKSAVGQTTNPADNTDMISPAFWLVSGTEFKITRSDDSTHTALLHTTGECLGGQTFRSKMTGYGDFRNSKVWAKNNTCLGKCHVTYGGQYQHTDGFQSVKCNGNVLDKIGFWCSYARRNGAVMTIGGLEGSGPCSRADHGIGITRANPTSFNLTGTNINKDEYDFGDRARNADASNTKRYSLNLWVK